MAPTISIIMPTVRDSEDDKVDALSAGADDYIMKPFAVRELVARIQAVARRGQMPVNPGSQLSIGEVSVCAERSMFFKRGEAIHLTKTEFEIVYLLMRNQGKPLTHKKILSAVWDLSIEITWSIRGRLCENCGRRSRTARAASIPADRSQRGIPVSGLTGSILPGMLAGLRT